MRLSHSTTLACIKRLSIVSPGTPTLNHFHAQQIHEIVLFGWFQKWGKTPKMDGENNGKPY